MRRFLLWLPLIPLMLFILMLVAPALALAAEAAAPDAVDLTPIIDYFVYAALSVAAAGGAWLIRLVSRWAGIKTDDAMAARIRLGLENGLRAAYQRHKPGLTGSASITARHAILADAMRYVVEHFPDATRHFKVERPEQLADLAAALLPKIEAEQGPRGGAVS